MPLWLKAAELIRREPRALFAHFDPRTVPALLFDGQDTWLTGANPGEDGWHHTPNGWSWPGRHPALSANTAVTLPGGVQAAGVLLGSLGAVDAARLASILVHEAFHVWQHQNPSPAWEANELAALTYPAGHEHVLHTRGEEATWLAAALATEDWRPAARQALSWRDSRHALLPAEHQQFERRMETLEGLAEFVETRFLHTWPTLTLEQAIACTPRQWAYHSGAALAHLLTRTGNAWQRSVMAGQPLDLVLAAELGGASPVPEGHVDVREAAHAAALAHAGKLAQLEADFAAQGGKRLHLSGATGLSVQGFDPMNTYALSGGRVLHTRYLRLSSPCIELEIMGGQALASGPSLLSITSLDVPNVPEPSVQGGQWMVKTDTLNIGIAADRLQDTPDGWVAALP